MSKAAIERFVAMVDTIENRGDMWMYSSRLPIGYAETVNYLLGYDHAEESAGRRRVLDTFGDFVHREVGHPSSLFWPYAIVRLLTDDSEEKALPVLFTLLHAYLEEQLAGD